MKTSARLVLSVAVALLSACALDSRGFPPTHGIANFDRVDAKVLRGAQPTNNALVELKKQGVRTIINLRAEGEVWPAEQENVKGAGMTYCPVPMSGWKRPADSDVRKVLDVLEGRDPQHPPPAYVHCHYGCDRTGMIIACYRIEHDHWSAEAALREADIFGMASAEIFQRRYVRDFAAKAK